MTEVVLSYWEIGGLVVCLFFAGYSSVKIEL